MEELLIVYGLQFTVYGLQFTVYGHFSFGSSMIIRQPLGKSHPTAFCKACNCPMPVSSNEIKDASDPKIIWNVPNALTMLRILLVPVFAVLYMKGFRMAALAVYCAAALTDLADGPAPAVN